MPSHQGFGMLAYDMAHMLGAAVLVLSFALLYQRRISAIINVYALQGWVLAAAAAWQGFVQGEANLYLTASVAVAANGIVLPIALRRVARRLAIHRPIETALGVVPSMIVGVALVALAIVVVLPITLSAGGLTREDLALALSVVLLGLLLMIVRRNALTQVVGFMALGNGLMLAAVSVTGMPLVIALSVAFLAMAALLVFGVFFFRVRERFESLDAARLNGVGEVPR
jgi:hydrogenase-4 component E